MIDDIGSGALIDFAAYGLPRRTDRARASVAAGADVVLFSGDKLLGGPQCGIIVGRRAWIQAIERHPLARAVRIDKLTLVALDATLRLYRHRETLEETLPLLTLLATSVENLKFRGDKLIRQLKVTPAVADAQLLAASSLLGGGAIPMQEIPTLVLVIEPRGRSAESSARQLRVGEPSVFGRIQDDRLHLDLRTIPAKLDSLLVDAFSRLPGEPPAASAEAAEPRGPTPPIVE